MATNVKIGKGLMWKLSNNKREPIEDLSDGLKVLADCGCGLDCCNNVIVLRDLETGEVVEVSVENGVLVVTSRNPPD